MKCRNCGAELASGVAFCRECGTKVVQDKRFCRECGSELAEGVKFCSNCGASVVINKEQVEDQTPSRNTEAIALKLKVQIYKNCLKRQLAFLMTGKE